MGRTVGKSVLLGLANNRQVESFVRGNHWSASAARRFVAGETIEQVIEPVRGLNARGISVSLDFLGESVSSEAQVAEVIDTYLRLFQHIDQQKLNANVSVKLTSLGLDIDEALCRRNMARLLAAAGPNQFVRIDMEGSAYTQRTLDLFTNLWDGPEQFRNVGVVIQSYLRRSAQDIERLIAMKARVRLCKGAYKELPDVAFEHKEEVDENYLRLMERLLKDGNYPGIATHDERMLSGTTRYARENGIPPDRYEFQMLYGIRRDLQERLVNAGYRLRIYTPFGTNWYPYLMRRLAERPANLWFVAKNLFHA